MSESLDSICFAFSFNCFFHRKQLTAGLFSSATEDPETPLLEPDFSDLKVHQKRVESKVCVENWKNSST